MEDTIPINIPANSIKEKHIELEVNDPHMTNLKSVEDLYLYKFFIEPVLRNKLLIILIEGASGEGKSMTSLSLAEQIEVLFHKVTGKGLDHFDPLNQVIYTPTEYADKIEKWTTQPYLTLVVDELRFLVPKEKWQSIVNQSIAEANATLRAVKKNNCGYTGIIIYNTQSLSDISKSIRKTLSYDIVVKREDTQVMARLYSFWEDRGLIERPVLKPKKPNFIIKGNYFKADKFIIPLPTLEVRKTFNKISAEAKEKILKRKREKIVKELRREMGEGTDWQNEVSQDKIFELLKGMSSYNQKKGVAYFTETNRMAIQKMYAMTLKEYKEGFLPKFNEEVKKRGLL